MSQIYELIEQLCPDGVEYKMLGEAMRVNRGKRVVKKNLSASEGYPVYQNSLKPLGYYGEPNRPGGTTFVICAGAAGDIGYSNEKFWSADDCFCLESNETLNGRYLYHVLSSAQPKLKAQVRRASIPRLSPKAIETLRIPVPPMEVQQEIVRVLDSFAELEAELEARHRQYDYYRDRLFADCDSIEWVSLLDLAKDCDRARKPIKQEDRIPGDTPYYGASGIVDHVDGFTHEGDYLLVSEDGANLVARTYPIAFQIHGRNWVNNHAHVLQINNEQQRKLVEIYLNSISLEPYISKGAQPKLTKKKLGDIKVPVPSEADLAHIVGILRQFDVLTMDISQGLPAEIDARRHQYAYYRDTLLKFDERVG